MARTAILVPFPQMCETARRVLQQYPGLDVMCVEYHPSHQVVDRAKQLKEQGCEQIVARGLQAMLIRKAVDLPLVEMRVTAQELATIIQRLKGQIAADCPIIALIGFENMLSDTARFNDLFGIQLRRYIVTESAELASAAELAAREGANAMIGGEIVCGISQRLNIPCAALPAEDESFHLALQEAVRSSNTIDLQRRSSEEISSMLDNSPSGMLRLDRDGTIRLANNAALSILTQTSSSVLGRPVQEILPQLDPRCLEIVLKEGAEAYTTVSDQRHRAVIINASPVVLDGRPEGAVFTLQEDARVLEMEMSLRQELYRQGQKASYLFSGIIAQSKETQSMIATAKRIARYSAPVLISGETGAGKSAIAQCIHNESLLRENGFVTIDCSAWLPETADSILFGNYTSRADAPACLAELAENGTLYIAHVEALQLETQYKLLCLIRGTFLHNGNNRPGIANVRVIASTSVNLVALVEDGKFRSDLYYALNVLSLEVLPLRRRREDIPAWTERYLKLWQKKYKRFVHLTQGALQFMEEYSWPGNLDQLDSICERIVLLAEKRNVDEVFLRHQLEQTSPHIQQGSDKVVLYRDPEGEKLAALLRKYGGSREKVAAELGISKTTLWRRMKKFGIEKDFTY